MAWNYLVPACATGSFAIAMHDALVPQVAQGFVYFSVADTHARSDYLTSAIPHSLHEVTEGYLLTNFFVSARSLEDKHQD
jgi:hypothetical protein